MSSVIFFIQDDKDSLINDIIVWENTLNMMDIKDFTLVDMDNLHPGNPNAVKTFWEALQRHPGIKVHVKQTGDIALEHYVHPDNACYIFGPDSGKLEIDFGLSIRLECEEVWAYTAASIVLYDKKTKLK